MNLGSVLSGAGQVAVGTREQMEVVRRARAQQLRLEEMNRANEQLKQQAQQGIAGPAPAAAPIPTDAFGVGTRPLPPPTPRAGVTRPGIPAAQNPTTTVGKVVAPPPAPAAPTGMTREDFLALSPTQRKNVLDTANTRAGSANPFIGAYDAAIAAPNFVARGLNKAADVTGLSGGLARAGRVLGVYGPEVTGVGLPEFPSVSLRKTMTEADYAASLPSRTPRIATGGGRGGPARAKNAAAGLDIPGGEMMPAEGFASDAAVQRYNDLTQKLPAALQTPEAQAVIGRAQELDVDPAAAITIFGIESNFGKAGGTSGKGAKGGMQVTDATFSGMKNWYTDPANQQVTPAQRDAAEQMQRGDPQSEVDAGLLRIKYNELVGVPKPLWGAAYQAPAEAVRDNGGPIDAGDGNFTNSEYNSVYTNLYNQAVNALGGPMPGAVATLASTGTPQSVSGSGAPAAAPAAAAGAAVPAGTAPRPAGVATPTAQPAGRPLSRAQFYLANPNALTSEMTAAQSTREQLVQMGNFYLQLRTQDAWEKAQAVKAQIRALDGGMVDMQGIQGVQELEMTNSPGRLAQALSVKTGQEVGIRPFTDGSFDIYINGKLAHENIDGGKLKDDALSMFDPSYRAQKADQAKTYYGKALDGWIEKMKQDSETFRELAKIQTQGDVSLWIEKFKAGHRAWDVKFNQDTGDIVLIPPGERVPLIYNPAGRTIAMGDSEITLTGAQEIPGLNLASAPQ